MICNCSNTTLPTINASDCPFEIGQIQRVIVVKNTQSVTGTSQKPLDAGSTWSALTTDSSNKISVMPEVFAPVWTPGDEIVVGENSNETPNGAGIKVGEWGASLGGNFSQQSPAALKSIKQLECFKGLAVYFVNQDGRIFGRGTDSANEKITDVTTGTLYPIPIARLSVKDYDGAGLDAATKNDFTIRFKQQWWENLAWVDSEDILESI